MKNKLACTLALLPLLLLCTCTRQTIFSEYHSLPRNGWNADSAICFTFAAPDTVGNYDIIVSIRHTQQYPYQNMWLFVGQTSAQQLTDSAVQQRTDTIEFYLADERGRWLGNGYGNIREMPVLYQHDITFPSTDTISLLIRHAMRENELHGIDKVGVQIVKSEE
ncbi:MAG: gliding motility lipoprotein GldH [Paludibacteraceae bacterium]|nr:gliding motility lipoprotein GldH [Paludibacteraceae bacterium]